MKRYFGLFFIFILMFIFVAGCSKEAEITDNLIDNVDENVIAEDNSLNEQLSIDEEEVIKNNFIELDLQSELVQSLYNYVATNDYRGEELFYRENKVTFEDLDTYVKQFVVYRVYKTDGLEQAPNQYYIDADFDVEENCKNEYILPVPLFEEYLKSIFGSNATIEHQSFTPFDPLNCDYSAEDNNYYYRYYMGGGDRDAPDLTKLSHATQSENGEYIYIYDKYVYLLWEQLEPTITLSLYSNGKKPFSTDIVNELYNIDINSGPTPAAYFPYDYDDLTNKFTIKDEIIPYMTDFCHTFKQAENGTYYWLSSEAINN